MIFVTERKIRNITLLCAGIELLGGLAAIIYYKLEEIINSVRGYYIYGLGFRLYAVILAIFAVLAVMLIISCITKNRVVFCLFSLFNSIMLLEVLSLFADVDSYHIQFTPKRVYVVITAGIILILAPYIFYFVMLAVRKKDSGRI